MGSTLSDIGRSVKVDGDGIVFVTGDAGGSLNGQPYAGGPADIFLLQYSSDGVLLSTNMTGSSGYDEGYGIAVGTTGAVYIAGSTDGALNGNTNQGTADICLVQYTNISTSSIPTFSLQFKIL